jgi:Methyltransferase domain
MLEWQSDSRLVVDGVVFAVEPGMTGARPKPEPGGLGILKPRWMIEKYAALQTQISGGNVVELGILEGGGAGLLALLLEPRRLVSIDLCPDRVEALDDFVDRRRLKDCLHAYYGVDQADRATLQQIVIDEFGSEPLDLVVDDASHLLEPTVASFNVLFPRLRPGGLFVLEDWSYEQRFEAGVRQQDPVLWERLQEGTPEPRVPLGRLVLQIVLAGGYDPGVVAEVAVDGRGWLVAQRGNAILDPTSFDIAERCGSVAGSLLV